MDGLIFVTRGTKEEHPKKVETVLTKLENEGNKASKKSKFQMKETVWLDTPLHKTGLDKTYKIRKQQNTSPDQHENTKILLGGNSLFCKIHTKFIREKDNMRQLLKKRTKW